MARLKNPATPEDIAMPETATGPDEDLQTVTANLPVPVEGLSFPGLEAWCSLVSECQHEMAHFVAERLEKDQEAVREALVSKDWANVATIQMRWLQQTMQDYAAEMSKTLSIYTRHGGARYPTTH